MGMVIAVGRLSARSYSVITGRKARKFCTIMLGFLDQKAEIVEHADEARQFFELAHPPAMAAGSGERLKLLMQAHSDFLPTYHQTAKNSAIAMGSVPPDGVCLPLTLELT